MLTTLELHDKKRERYIKTREKMSTRAGGRYSHDCLMHMERTLDETYFPGLTADELFDRNLDQIVSREFASGDKRAPIIIVPSAMALVTWRMPHICSWCSSRIGRLGPFEQEQ